MELNLMSIASTNVIPSTIPSKKSQPNFGMSREERERERKNEERKLREQKYELEKLANDKTNPISAPMKVLAVVTGAVITAGAMKVTMNTSLGMISKMLKSEKVMKLRKNIAEIFNTMKNATKEGYKTFKQNIATKYNESTLSVKVKARKEQFAKTGLGKFINEKISPKYKNFKEALKILNADIKEVSKEKMPTKDKIKKVFVDATAILAGGGVAIKESGALNKSSRYEDNEEEY